MFLSIIVDEWCNTKAKQSSWASKMVSGEAEAGTIYWQIRDATCHPYHCTASQVEDKDGLISGTSPGCEEHEERITLLPFFPWGVEISFTEGVTWLLVQPLEHYSKKKGWWLIKDSPLPHPRHEQPLWLLLLFLLSLSWWGEQLKPHCPYTPAPPPPPPLFSSCCCTTNRRGDQSAIFKRRPQV